MSDIVPHVKKNPVILVAPPADAVGRRLTDDECDAMADAMVDALFREHDKDAESA